MGKNSSKNADVYNYNGTRWEGNTEEKEKKEHIHVQGMWFKSLDLKTTSS